MGHGRRYIGRPAGTAPAVLTEVEDGAGRSPPGVTPPGRASSNVREFCDPMGIPLCNGEMERRAGPPMRDGPEERIGPGKIQNCCRRETCGGMAYIACTMDYSAAGKEKAPIKGRAHPLP
jgi:hypothetical protein